MVELWSSKDILGPDKRDILVWYYIANHHNFETIIRLS